jgi:hypothetical protein
MKPILQALLIADHLYQDTFTGKMIIAGVFSHLGIIKKSAPVADQIPSEVIPTESQLPPESEKIRQLQPYEVQRAGSPYCYINLTSLHGELPLELRYVDLIDNSVLIKIDFQVKCDDPLENLEIVLAIPPLPHPHPGCYAMELLSQDELIGSHRITVTDVSPSVENEGY